MGLSALGCFNMSVASMEGFSDKIRRPIRQTMTFETYFISN